MVAQFDLSVPCPHCHAKIEPAEQRPLDNQGTELCIYCGKTFNAVEVLRAVRQAKAGEQNNVRPIRSQG
jgi:predicted CXXCH cytochrome family protein